MNNLNPKDVFGSLQMLPDQIESVWTLSKEIDYPDRFKNLKRIVCCAMGGSMYGAYIANALFHDSLKAPIITLGDYRLPGFASSDTLIILSSYSGNTEEPINCAEEAVLKKLPLTVLTYGGKASEIAQQNNLPALIFDPKFNPSDQPRLGSGYMVLGILGILNQLGYIFLSDQEIIEGIEFLNSSNEGIKKQAEALAKELERYIPLVIAAEHLNGNIHILRNQINETAKSFSAFAELPELNHHLMEGLKNPPDKKIKTLFINSNLYSEKLTKRMEITKDVIEKNGLSYIEYNPQSKTKFLQMLEVLSFGGYLSYYLAMLYKQDPSVIPWVDYFKNELQKSS